MAHHYTAIIESSKLLDSLPSGSGIVVEDDHAWIIGDDAPFVYRLSLEDYTYESIPLLHHAGATYRIPKPVKPDYESGAVGIVDGRKVLAAFGSGSKSPQRDTVLVVDMEQPGLQRVFDASYLYNALQAQTYTDAAQWNLEAAVMYGDKLYLCNRGNNMVLSMSWVDVIAYLKGKGSPPVVNYRKITLPEISGHEARISGACGLSGGLILFCASVEDTPDWVSDGPVLGSYIGIIDLDRPEGKELHTCLLLKDASGRAMTEKLESVDLLGKDEDGSLRVIAIADNDQGNTRVLKIRLKKS